jgi:hypothetical protein
MSGNSLGGHRARSAVSCSRTVTGCSVRHTMARTWSRRPICGRGASMPNSKTGHRCGYGSADRDQRLPDRARAQQPAHAAVGPWRSGRRSVRRAGARAAGGVALELARRQGATFFELRAAVDDFDLRGEPARVAVVDAASRIPTDSRPPELARAPAALESTTPRTRIASAAVGNG